MISDYVLYTFVIVGLPSNFATSNLYNVLHQLRFAQSQRDVCHDVADAQTQHRQKAWVGSGRRLL